MLLSTEECPIKTTATVKPSKYGPCTTFEISAERLKQLLADVADPHLFEYMTLVALCRRVRMEQFNALTFDPSKGDAHDHDEEDIEDEVPSDLDNRRLTIDHRPPRPTTQLLDRASHHSDPPIIHQLTSLSPHHLITPLPHHLQYLTAPLL